MKRGKGNEWLLLKKKDAFAQPGWDPEDHAHSVLTGRTQEEIAREPESADSRSRFAQRSRQSCRCPNHLADAGADRQGRRRPPATTGSTKSNGTASARSATSKTAGCGWSRATAMRWTGSIPSCPILPHHVKARHGDSGWRNRGAGRARPAQFRAAAAPHQRRRRERHRDAWRATVRWSFFAFDLLYLDGRDLRGEPLDRAKAAAERNPEARTI